MKNFKKTISLILAICMIASLAISASAANTVDASGGTGTSSVTLSSTADGSIGGDPAATKMSVTVPTVLPIAVGTDGTVSTATDAKIVNNSFGAVKVNSVSIEAAQNWHLTAFGDCGTQAETPATEPTEAPAEAPAEQPAATETPQPETTAPAEDGSTETPAVSLPTQEQVEQAAGSLYSAASTVLDAILGASGN